MLHSHADPVYLCKILGGLKKISFKISLCIFLKRLENSYLHFQRFFAPDLKSKSLQFFAKTFSVFWSVSSLQSATTALTHRPEFESRRYLILVCDFAFSVHVNLEGFACI